MNRLARPTIPGTNTVLIGHAEFTPTCPVLSDLVAGEAAIYKPDGNGGVTFVTRVLADEWARLP
jgi:hypothetical protein